MPIQVIILAAGQGSRMHSTVPKVLHPIGDKPIIEHIVKTAQQISSKPPMIVFGHEGQQLQAALQNFPIQWVVQTEQLGTAHAVQQTLPQLNADDTVLILCGDVPLISKETLQQLMATCPANEIGMLTAIVQHPEGYGRIKRDAATNIISIIEEKDASRAERNIQEINPGIYLFPVNFLKKYLTKIKNTNSQKEFYLTDIIRLAVEDKMKIKSMQPSSNSEILGINDKQQLAQLERVYQQQIAEKLMQQGVTLKDPARFDVRGEIEIGQEVLIDINVILEGKVTIGNHCTIGANTIIRNSEIADHVVIKENCIIEESKLNAHASVGPFARIRPGTQLDSYAHIGNFVEVKNSRVGEKTKISHLTYIGDSQIGKNVNIGAGTITCNYDGEKKNQTIIEDNAFIGSNTELVAPVTIGEGGLIGAGSTITKDTPPYQLTLSRSPQVSVKTKKIDKKTVT